MPRLPVKEDDDGSAGKPAPAPTIHLSYAGLALGVSLLGVFLAGDLLLPGWLGLDLDCLDMRSSRRSEAFEMVVCAAGAGPAGWVFLAWVAAPLALFSVWLKRSLSRARTQR